MAENKKDSLTKQLEEMFDLLVKDGFLPKNTDRDTTIQLVKEFLKEDLKNGNLNKLKPAEFTKNLRLHFQFAATVSNLVPGMKNNPRLMLQMNKIQKLFNTSLLDSDKKSLNQKRAELRLLLKELSLLTKLAPANQQKIASLVERIIHKSLKNNPDAINPSSIALANILLKSLNFKPSQSKDPVDNLLDKEMSDYLINLFDGKDPRVSGGQTFVVQENIGDFQGVIDSNTTEFTATYKEGSDPYGIKAEMLLRNLTLGDATLQELGLVSTDEVSEENKKRPSPTPFSTKPTPE